MLRLVNETQQDNGKTFWYNGAESAGAQ